MNSEILFLQLLHCGITIIRNNSQIWCKYLEQDNDIIHLIDLSTYLSFSQTALLGAKIMPWFNSCIIFWRSGVSGLLQHKRSLHLLKDLEKIPGKSPSTITPFALKGRFAVVKAQELWTWNLQVGTFTWNLAWSLELGIIRSLSLLGTLNLKLFCWKPFMTWNLVLECLLGTFTLKPFTRSF